MTPEMINAYQIDEAQRIREAIRKYFIRERHRWARIEEEEIVLPTYERPLLKVEKPKVSHVKIIKSFLKALIP